MIGPLAKTLSAAALPLTTRRSSVRRACIFGLLCFSLSPLGAARAEPVYPANGVVGIEPPKGMTEAPNFAGFTGDDGASIVIVEMPPEAFDEVATKFSADGLASQMEVEGAVRELTLNGDVKALLARGEQSAHGIRFRKWVLLARHAATTALVTVQIPDTDTHYSDADIVSALQSLRIRSGTAIEAQIDALPFTIGNRAGFRPVRTLAGSALIMTEGPANSYENGSQPIVIIAASMGDDRRFSDMSGDERGRLAHRMVEQLGFAQPAMERVADSEEGEVILAGAAVDPKRDHRVLLRQILRIAGTGYVRVVCVAKPEQPITARCDQIARSIVLKDRASAGGGPP